MIHLIITALTNPEEGYILRGQKKPKHEELFLIWEDEDEENEKVGGSMSSNFHNNI